MNQSGVAIDVGHVTSALRACWAAEGRRENASWLLPNIMFLAFYFGAASSNVSTLKHLLFVTPAGQAAKFLFQLLRDLGLTPNVATCTCLVGAYADAGLDDILSAYHEMQGLGIQPDAAFAETYLGAVLRDLREERSFEDVAAKLRQKSADRLWAARKALADFNSAGVELTALSTNIAKAFRAIPNEKPHAEDFI